MLILMMTFAPPFHDAFTVIQGDADLERPKKEKIMLQQVIERKRWLQVFKALRCVFKR